MSIRLKGFATAFAGQILLLGVLVLVVDLLSYFFAPPSITWKFHYYKWAESYIGEPEAYPQHYYVAHPQRGFDIDANREATHEMPEVSYRAHSNSLGCFDREWPEIPERFLYFGGDSFTWGFTPYGDRFADRFEAATGVPSLKCGVSSTAARHQFDKFLDISARIGRFPDQVILNFFVNDVEGDHLHPQSTVMDGWLVPARYFDANGDPFEVSTDWTRAMLEAALASPPQAESCDDSLVVRLKCYSLTANILNTIRQSVMGIGRHQGDYDPGPIDHYGQTIYKRDPTLTEPPSDDIFPYLDNPVAVQNQQALRRWKQHAVQEGYDLMVVLVPPLTVLSRDQPYYQEVVTFLNRHEIETLNLLPAFRARGLGRHDAYWRYDGHFSPKGHALVAELLTQWYQTRSSGDQALR